MKYLSLFLIPLLFLACKKDELVIAVSEGEKITRIESYKSEEPIGGTPSTITNFFYDSEERLYERHRTSDGRDADTRVERFTYNHKGQLISQKNGKIVDGEFIFGNKYTPSYSADSDNMIGYTWYKTIDNGNSYYKLSEHLVFYNEDNQIVRDSILYDDDYLNSEDPPDQFTTLYSDYQWNEGNIVQADEFNFFGKKTGTRVYRYDDKKNYQKDFIIFPISGLFVLPFQGKNNHVELWSHMDVITTCNPCATKLKYNSLGYPYLAETNHGEKSVLFYSRD